MTKKTYKVDWIEHLDAAVQHINDRNIDWLGGYSPRQILFGRMTRALNPLYRQSLQDEDIMDGEVQRAFDGEQQPRVEDNVPRIIRTWEIGQ